MADRSWYFRVAAWQILQRNADGAVAGIYHDRAGGGFYAVLNLYYYALVILRRQKLIFGIYAVLTVLAAILAPRLTVALGIFGAAFAYLILMIVMAAGFVGGAWFEIQKEIREVRHDS